MIATCKKCGSSKANLVVTERENGAGTITCPSCGFVNHLKAPPGHIDKVFEGIEQFKKFMIDEIMNDAKRSESVQLPTLAAIAFFLVDTLYTAQPAIVEQIVRLVDEKNKQKEARAT